jgi:hypothetical protein
MLLTESLNEIITVVRVHGSYHRYVLRKSDITDWLSLFNNQNLILSHVGVSIRRGIDWMIESIDTLYTPLRTTINYSAIADLRTLQFSVTHISAFSLH